MVRNLSVLFAVLTIACSSTTDPATDILSAHAENQTLTLVNTSDDPVYFFAADKEALALLDWAICLDPAKCTPVQPHSSKDVPYSQIAAYQHGSGNAIVYHWRIIAKGSGYDYDKLRELEVKLH
jgi:ABC-type Fe3+-hydroxamate transport system substrate-binding protein